MERRPPTKHLGFTLVELLIAIAVLAVVLTLAAPSFRNMIEMQRLKSISSQLMTDIQLARSEAVSRQRNVYVTFSSSANPPMSCYTIHTCGGPNDCTCTCTEAPGSSCSGTNVEIRTVQVPTNRDVRVALRAPPDETASVRLVFDPVTGGMPMQPYNSLGEPLPVLSAAWAEACLIRGGDSAPALRAVIARTGRPTLCSPGGRVPGAAECPGQYVQACREP